MLTFALSLALAPDLIAPGHKPVQHQLVLEASAHFEQHRFFAEPVHGFSGFQEIRPGEPFDFSSKYSTRIFALPRDVTPDAGAKVASLAVASGNIPVSETSSVVVTSPVERVETRLKLVRVENGVLELAVVASDEQYSGAMLAAIGGGIALCATGLVLFARSRQRSAAKSA
jgi:hypothetical protein